MAGEFVGPMVGAIALGAVHGAEPGHGWPVAASYAMDRDRRGQLLRGAVAGSIIGVGHLISSLAVVALFFLAASALDLSTVNEPLSVFGVRIGGPVSVVAGLLLIALGIREYRGGGHSHDHGDGDGDSRDGPTETDGSGVPVADVPGTPVPNPRATGGEGRTTDDGHGHAADDHAAGDHDHADDGHGHGEGHGHDHGHGDHSHGAGHDHSGDDDHDGDHGHDHSGGDHGHGHGLRDAADGGLWSIAWAAFLLGFAHEEEFEIIALCAGSGYCLELMTAYALTVVVAIVALTVLLVAGYRRFEDRVGRAAEHFPTVSAVVLVVMGVGFVLGLF